MAKLIHLRFDAKCRKCGNAIPAGNRAAWAKGVGASHYPDCTPKPITPARKTPKPDMRIHTLEWAKVKQNYLDLISGRKSVNEIVTRTYNRATLSYIYSNYWKAQPDWCGCTIAEMEIWVNAGFHVPGIENADPDLIPTRKRRKLKFGEDGEIQLDLVYSGHDYPFLEWEKRERKPGMRMEIGMAFSSMTKPNVVAQYERWLAQAITTLEEFGYDLEVSVFNQVKDAYPRNPGADKTLIRVKRENEISDFAQWSALFSPGGNRHLVFLAQIMAADETGNDISTGLGRPFGEEWEIELDSETRVMRIENPRTPDAFPEALMSEKFLALIGNK